MAFFKRLIDVITLSSTKPLRRLTGYYLALALVVIVVLQLVPAAKHVFAADQVTSVQPALLQDALNEGTPLADGPLEQPGLTLAIGMIVSFLSAIALMLPVSWVYMSARAGRTHNQSVAQTLILLPIVVAGVVLVVRNSLALAFSLAGVVAAVRFRTSLSDTRDVVFIFLAIAVGFAVGVQGIALAALVSLIFNYTMVLVWHYDFGRAVLEPAASAQWAEPLKDLAAHGKDGAVVPDRDIVLALTPAKVDTLAQRFDRLRGLVGTNGKKPRYDAVLSVTSSKVADAQQRIESALDDGTKRWKLDSVVNNVGKPSELYYLMRLRKAVGRDALLTMIRARANGTVESADIEVGDAAEVEDIEEKRTRKQRERELV